MGKIDGDAFSSLPIWNLNEEEYTPECLSKLPTRAVIVGESSPDPAWEVVAPRNITAWSPTLHITANLSSRINYSLFLSLSVYIPKHFGKGKRAFSLVDAGASVPRMETFMLMRKESKCKEYMTYTCLPSQDYLHTLLS